MDFNKLAHINLIKGAGGGDPSNGLCIMELVSYFDDADHVTDRPQCACPVLTEWAVRLNDSAPTQAARDGLKPLLPLLSGSRDDSARQKRAEHIVREVTHRLVAPIFAKHWPQHAKALLAAQTMAEIKHAAANVAAAAAAAAVAYAAAANAVAYAAWKIRREILVEAIHLGAHGGLDLDAPATDARAEQLLAGGT